MDNINNDNTNTVGGTAVGGNTNTVGDNSGTQVSPTTVVQGSNNKINISSIIEDNTGGLSSIRVLMLLWGCGVFGIWAAGAIVALYHGLYVYPSLPPEIITILLGVTGIKTVQRFGER